MTLFAVTEKLAACVNIIPGISSVYVWEGKVENDDELLMMIKVYTCFLSSLFWEHDNQLYIQQVCHLTLFFDLDEDGDRAGPVGVREEEPPLRRCRGHLDFHRAGKQAVPRLDRQDCPGETGDRQIKYVLSRCYKCFLKMFHPL